MAVFGGPAPAPSTPPSGASAGDGGLIAFVSDRDGNHEVYAMNANGTGQTNLTNNPGVDSGPSWSPDGRKIAFVDALKCQLPLEGIGHSAAPTGGITIQEWLDMGAVAPDHDADGVPTAEDNCPLTANPDQSDNDGDGFPGSQPASTDTFGGDACDPDDDNDGIADGADNCPLVLNPSQADSDSGGVGDARDNCPSVSNTRQTDSDSDGVGDACEPTPTLTPTRTPTLVPTPAVTPTALPEVGTPAVVIPMLVGWNFRCYRGEETSIEGAIGGIADNVLAVYTLNSDQGFDRWFPGRPDISNMMILKSYDQLFVLMSAPERWEQLLTALQPSVDLVEGWNSVCYAGRTKPAQEATEGIVGKFSILYTFLDTQAWARYVPERPEPSDISQLQQFDAVLVLITQGGGTTWVFEP
jgi:hypothetical protein